MEIIRFVNEDEIDGVMPPIWIRNPGVLQVVREMQMRIIQEETENCMLTENG